MTRRPAPDAGAATGSPGARRGAAFTSGEIALLGLMAALWGAAEATLGGAVKSWHVPFGGSLLSALGVVVLLSARARVPRRWSSILIGAAAAGIRLVSGLAGAVFAALAILAEAAIVETVLSVSPPRRRFRFVAGVLAVLWSLVHPFVVQGYLAGYGPGEVYRFTIGFMVSGDGPGAPHTAVVLGVLVVIHIILGVLAVVFAEKIAPASRGSRADVQTTGRAPAGRGAHTSRRDGTLLTGVILLLVALCATSASAQGTMPALYAPGTPEAAYELPEYTVFGTRLVGPYTVFELTVSDVEESGAEDLSEVLQTVPGLDVRTGSRGEARLSTRGLADRQMVILVDGVPLSDPYTGSVNPSMLLAGAIGTVRVTKGPVASVYGANALGGVVEVTTVAHEHTGLTHRLAGGSDGRYSGHVSGSGRLGRIDVVAGVAARGRSDFSLPESYEEETREDGDVRDYSSQENVFAWGRASWKPGPRTAASVGVQVADSSWDAPASTSSDRPRFWSFPYWREVRATGSFAVRPGDDLSVETTVFYATNDNDLASYNDLERTDRAWLSSVANRAFGGYAYVEYRGLGRQRVTGGVNVRGDIARLRDDVGEEWEEYDSTTASVFAQDELSISESDLVSVAMNVDMMSGEGESLVRLNPQAAYTRRLGGPFSARLLAGMKTRFPTLKEWFSPSIGNPDLKPEKSASVELELSASTHAGSISLVGFRQFVEDMIATAGKGEPAENLDSVTCVGAELAAAHRFPWGLGVRLGLSALSAKDDETDENIPLIPETMTTLLATYERGRGRLTVRVQGVGARYDEDAGDLPAYTLVGLRGSFDTPWGELFAVVDNAFDELYEHEDGFPGPGRSLEVGVARSLYR